MDSKLSSLSSEQKLKVATFLEVRKVVEEVGENIQFAFSKQSMDLIAELAWRKLRVAGTDLEAFARHAKRSTVNAEDVKLLARRNPVLKGYLNEMAEELKSKKDQKKKTNKVKDPVPAVDDQFDDPVPSTSRVEMKDEEPPYFEEKIELEDDFEPVKVNVGYRPDSPIVLSD